jgi:hypothetical protein
MSKGSPITFAFYKDDELVGYRQDTVGTIGDKPKIYHYDADQVQSVLNNITHNVRDKRPGIVDYIKNRSPKAGAVLGNTYKNINTKLKNLITFEVRVLECPENEYYVEYMGEENTEFKWPIYPKEAMQAWMQLPEDERTVIETHYFGVDGLIVNQ